MYPNGYQRVGVGAERLPTPLPQRGGNGVPLSLEELKRQEQLRYLQQIQTEQLLEHQVLQQQQQQMKNNNGGRQQKQMFQNRRLPIMQTSPTPPAMRPGGGGITKRASAYKWPFNHQKYPTGAERRMGNPPPGGRGMSPRRRPPPPPPQQRQQFQGPPPPQNARIAQQSQLRPVMMRGPPPPTTQQSMQQRPPPPSRNPQFPTSFQQQAPFPRQFQPIPQEGVPLGLKNVGRRGHASDDDYDDMGETGFFEDQIPHPQIPKSQNQQYNSLPHQMMLPPPSPSSNGIPPPQFRQFNQNKQPQEDIRHLQGPHPSQIPHGLQMLR